MTDSRFVLRAAALLACALACEVAWSQSAAVASASTASAAERAQKETDRTMYWIRVLADKPAAKPAPAAALKPVAAAPAPQARPAAEPRDKTRVAAARTTADAANATPAAVVVAEPAAPVPAAVGNAPEPAALSTSAADNAAAAVGTTAAGLAAPSASAPELDVAPPPAEEPDPGLVMTKSVEPEFPTYTVRRMRKGSVEVRFEVDPAGVVTDAAVVKSSHASLNTAAVDAIRQWRFKPTPKSHTALVDLVFNIDN